MGPSIREGAMEDHISSTATLESETKAGGKKDDHVAYFVKGLEHLRLSVVHMVHPSGSASSREAF